MIFKAILTNNKIVIKLIFLSQFLLIFNRDRIKWVFTTTKSMHNVSGGGFRVAFFTVSVSSSFWSDRGFLNDGSLDDFWGFDNFCVVLIMCDNLDIDFYINLN